MERLRGGEQTTEVDGTATAPRTNAAEIAQAATAIAGLRHTAVAAAVGEASLRNGLRQVFVSLARRNQSLLQRQLRLIDALEQKASDPAALADLFALDHLTTRMRRHAESLTILSGAAPGRSWSEPVPVIDVIRGATAEVEDYKRVTVLTRAEDAVAGSAVADMIHLLAELIENATLFSPSDTRVEVRAERVANGFAIEIDDRGLGIEPDQLNEINQQLVKPPDFDLANADRLGLFVGDKLAARHGVRVSLRPSPYGGTSAIVLMPSTIVVPAAEAGTRQRADTHPAIGQPTGLELRSAEASALAGRHSSQPALSASLPGTAAGGPFPGGPFPGGPVPGGPGPGGPVPGGPFPGGPVPGGPLPWRPGPWRPVPWRPGPWRPGPWQPGPWQPVPWQPGPCRSASRWHLSRSAPPHPPGELVPAPSGRPSGGRRPAIRGPTPLRRPTPIPRNRHATSRPRCRAGGNAAARPTAGRRPARAGRAAGRRSAA